MKIERPKPKQKRPDDARLAYKGRIFSVYEWDQELYDGSKITFEQVKRPDTVVVFPILPDGRIILTEQEQPGKAPFAGATGGRVDEGEDPIDAAKRELLEESGYTADEFILWDAQQPIGKMDWAIFTFVAKGLKKVAEPELDGGEKIKLITASLEELVDIPTNKSIYFAEQEIILKLMEAKNNPQKMEELRLLFAPK